MDEAGAFVRLKGGEGRKKIHPADIEKVVARMARIPPQSVSTSDRGSSKPWRPPEGRGLRPGQRHRRRS